MPNAAPPSAEGRSFPSWEPIATAPVDGTRILVGHECVKGVVVARWTGWRDTDTNEIAEAGWYRDEMKMCSPQPTLWMPLPPAPYVPAQERRA